MRKVYYAHAICLYGRADEREELKRIRKRFRAAAQREAAEARDLIEKLKSAPELQPNR